MKKTFSIKEISETLNISSATIRVWIRKYVEGEVYSKKNINYLELRRGLEKYGRENVESKLGCKLEDIEIVVGEKTKNEYIRIQDMEIGFKYIIRNYSIEKVREFVGVFEDEVNNESVFIFRGENKKKEDGGIIYDSMSFEELNRDCIKIKEYVEE